MKLSKRERKKLKRINGQFNQSHQGTRVMNYTQHNKKFAFSSSETTPKVSDLRRFTAGFANTIIPKVWYSDEAYAKIEYLVDKCMQEVGWLGLVEVVDGGYLITEIFVPKQTVTGAETDISPQDMSDMVIELYEQYPDFDSSKMYYWGHSHVNMGVTPSGQDESQIDDFLENCPIFIRGIHNKRGLSKVDVYDLHQEKVFQCVETGLIKPQLTEATKVEMDELITAKVTARAYTTATYNNEYWKNGGYPRHTQHHNQHLTEAQKMHQARQNHLNAVRGLEDDDLDDIYDWQSNKDLVEDPVTKLFLPASYISKAE